MSPQWTGAGDETEAVFLVQARFALLALLMLQWRAMMGPWPPGEWASEDAPFDTDRLEVWKWPRNAAMREQREFFPPDAFDEAIDRARELAVDPGRQWINITVVNSVRTEIARFTPWDFYRPGGIP